MAERWDGWSGENCWLQRKMTEDYNWIGVQENISMFSKSQSDRNSLI